MEPYRGTYQSAPNYTRREPFPGRERYNEDKRHEPGGAPHIVRTALAGRSRDDARPPPPSMRQFSRPAETDNAGHGSSFVPRPYHTQSRTQPNRHEDTGRGTTTLSGPSRVVVPPKTGRGTTIPTGPSRPVAPPKPWVKTTNDTGRGTTIPTGPSRTVAPHTARPRTLPRILPWAANQIGDAAKDDASRPSVPATPISPPRVRSAIAKKREPHIFLSADCVPTERHRIKNLRGVYKAYGFQDVLMDAAGFYITFPDTREGRAWLVKGAQSTRHIRLFGAYRLVPRVFYDGKEVTNLQQLNTAPVVERSRPSSPGISVRGRAAELPATMHTQHDGDILSDAPMQSFAPRPLSSSPPVSPGPGLQQSSSITKAVQKIGAKVAIEAFKTDIQSVFADMSVETFKAKSSPPVKQIPKNPLDDSSSTASDTSASSRSKAVKCHVCNGLGGALSACPTCSRHYHKHCRPLKSTAETTEMHWQCQSCVERGILSTRKGPTSVITFTEAASAPANKDSLVENDISPDVAASASLATKSRNVESMLYAAIAATKASAAVSAVYENPMKRAGAGAEAVIAHKNQLKQADVTMKSRADADATNEAWTKAAEVYRNQLKRKTIPASGALLTAGDALPHNGGERPVKKARTHDLNMRGVGDTQPELTLAVARSTVPPQSKAVGQASAFLRTELQSSITTQKRQADDMLQHETSKPSDGEEDLLSEARNLVDQSFATPEEVTVDIAEPKKPVFKRVKRPNAVHVSTSMNDASRRKQSEQSVQSVQSVQSKQSKQSAETHDPAQQAPAHHTTLNSPLASDDMDSKATQSLQVEVSRIGVVPADHPTAQQPSHTSRDGLPQHLATASVLKKAAFADSVIRPSATRVGRSKAQRTKIRSMLCSSCGNKNVPYHISGKAECGACKSKAEMHTSPSDRPDLQGNVVSLAQALVKDQDPTEHKQGRALQAETGEAQGPAFKSKADDAAKSPPDKPRADEESMDTTPLTTSTSIEATEPSHVAQQGSAGEAEHGTARRESNPSDGQPIDQYCEPSHASSDQPDSAVDVGADTAQSAQDTSGCEPSTGDCESSHGSPHQQDSGVESAEAGDTEPVFEQSDPDSELTEVSDGSPPPGASTGVTAALGQKVALRKSQRCHATSALDLGDSEQRPNGTYMRLIGMAMCAAPDYRATPAWIVKWIADNIPGYQRGDGTWMKGIQATVCMNAARRSGPVLVTAHQQFPDETGMAAKKKIYELLPGMVDQIEHWDATLQQPRLPGPAPAARSGFKIKLGSHKPAHGGKLPSLKLRQQKTSVADSEATGPSEEDNHQQTMRCGAEEDVEEDAAMAEDAEGNALEDDEPLADTQHRRSSALLLSSASTSAPPGVKCARLSALHSPDTAAVTASAFPMLPRNDGLSAADQQQPKDESWDTDEEMAMLNMIRADNQEKKPSSRSLFADRPHLHPDYNATQQAKVAEIIIRRQQQIDERDNKRREQIIIQQSGVFPPPRPPVHASRGREQRPRPQFPVADGPLVEEFDTLEAFLAVPDDLVPAIVDKELVFRHSVGRGRQVYRTGI